MDYIATFVHTYVYIQENTTSASCRGRGPTSMAQFGVGSNNHMQLPYKATVPDQAESKAALIVAYLILYRLSCHHILQVTMAIVYVCMRWSMVHVCLLRTPKWCGDF